MDTPLSSNIHIQGKVMGVRDLRGACRYLDFGNASPAQRGQGVQSGKGRRARKSQGKKLDYHTVVEEFWSFSKARLVER